MSDFQRVSVDRISVMDIYSPKHRPKNVEGRNFYALSYRFSGEVIIESNGKRYVSTPDTVTFTPKGLPYRTAVKEDTYMIVVHFHLTQDVDIRPPSVISAAGSELRSLFLRLSESYTVSEPNDFTCMSLFYQILAALEQLASDENTASVSARAAKHRIDENFSDPDLSIAEIAREIGVSDSYLRRSFRAAYHISPVEYLARVRIRHAKNLLESEYVTVSQIALFSGFHSAGYFIQSFRSRTGETPSAYRARKAVSKK